MYIPSHHVKSGFFQTVEMDGLLTKQCRNEYLTVTEVADC